MKTLLTLALAAATTLTSLPALADAGTALVAKHNCLVCHAVDKKVVGPSYKDISAKYRGNRAAAAKLVQKIRLGSSGEWGNVPMAANSAVPDTDAKLIADWILNLR